MPGTQNQARTAGTVPLSTYFCRQVELDELYAQLQRPDCSAIFLSSETGMGATSLLRELATIASKRVAVISLQGTPSLAAIPFGILAPFLRRTSCAFVESHVDAIRKTLALLDDKEAHLRATLGEGLDLGRPLIIIDEADYIDTATATVVVSLAQAEKIKVVVAHRAANDPVSPLPQLWQAGVAERFHLRPLNREDGHEFCVGLLGGPTTANSSWYFWNTAGGNPLLMRLVMEDALASGRLRLRGDLWIMDVQSVSVGHQLQSVVREQLRGLSSDARKTLDLVALSEPVSAEIVSQQLGAEALKELFERDLVQESFDSIRLLRLINPIYGEVIREMVPRSQSRMLHSRLINVLKLESSTPESALRMVIWTLESGLPVPDSEVLSAAIFACKLYESGVALRLAEEIRDPHNRGRARAVKARAHFNMGEYAQAAALLEHHDENAASISELLFGGLLRAALQSALALPPQAIHDAATALRQHGERLARKDPENAADILLRSGERAHIIDLMAHSRAGNYNQMSGHIQEVLNRSDGHNDPDHVCNRSLALAFEAEKLSALGFPLSGMAQAAAAFAIVQAEDHDVFFVPEWIISRAQVAILTAGQWEEAEQSLNVLAVDVGKGTISFGGSVGVARGMMRLRQGHPAAALGVLLEGLDVLRHSDPQQLMGYCISMAAYAAAKLGRHDTARELIEQYGEDTSMYIVLAHERAFIAAAREYLNGDGAGVGELLGVIEDSAERGLLSAELNALSLLMDFAPGNARARILSVAGKVEGRWAAGLYAYASALEQRQASIMVDAAEQLLEAQMYQHAGRLLRLADSTAAKERDSLINRRIRHGLEQIERTLGAQGEPGGKKSGGHQRMRERLTARELEIALMAAQGLTDKVIGAQLHVSVRTVEGHLYRAYAKLEITDRNDLALILSD